MSKRKGKIITVDEWIRKSKFMADYEGFAYLVINGKVTNYMTVPSEKGKYIPEEVTHVEMYRG